ncbi:MAG: hypothetical protein ACKO34_05210, partial [Vampirovibrionales bacterium]
MESLTPALSLDSVVKRSRMEKVQGKTNGFCKTLAFSRLRACTQKYITKKRIVLTQKLPIMGLMTTLS